MTENLNARPSTPGYVGISATNINSITPAINIPNDSIIDKKAQLAELLLQLYSCKDAFQNQPMKILSQPEIFLTPSELENAVTAKKNLGYLIDSKLEALSNDSMTIPDINTYNDLICILCSKLATLRGERANDIFANIHQTQRKLEQDADNLSYRLCKKYGHEISGYDIKIIQECKLWTNYLIRKISGGEENELPPLTMDATKKLFDDLQNMLIKYEGQEHNFQNILFLRQGSQMIEQYKLYDILLNCHDKDYPIHNDVYTSNIIKEDKPSDGSNLVVLIMEPQYCPEEVKNQNGNSETFFLDSIQKKDYQAVADTIIRCFMLNIKNFNSQFVTPGIVPDVIAPTNYDNDLASLYNSIYDDDDDRIMLPIVAIRHALQSFFAAKGLCTEPAPCDDSYVKQYKQLAAQPNNNSTSLEASSDFPLDDSNNLNFLFNDPGNLEAKNLLSCFLYEQIRPVILSRGSEQQEMNMDWFFNETYEQGPKVILNNIIMALQKRIDQGVVEDGIIRPQQDFLEEKQKKYEQNGEIRNALMCEKINNNITRKINSLLQIFGHKINESVAEIMKLNKYEAKTLNPLENSHNWTSHSVDKTKDLEAAYRAKCSSLEYLTGASSDDIIQANSLYCQKILESHIQSHNNDNDSKSSSPNSKVKADLTKQCCVIY